MTPEAKDANRQHRILKAIVEHGSLSLPGIRKYVHKPVYADLHMMLKNGYIVEAGMVPAGRASPIKELMSYKATRAGIAFAHVEPEKVYRGPGKNPRKELVLGRSNKMTTKLQKVDDAEITYTENTKFTKHETKYEFHVYQPPKRFMECVR